MNAPFKPDADLAPPTEGATTYGATVRRDEAIRRVQDRFYRDWHKLVADRDADLRTIDRAYKLGRF